MEKIKQRIKAVILLRSWGRRFLALLCVPLLLVGLVLPVSVGALTYDYNDLNPQIVVNGNEDVVTVFFDPSKVQASYENVVLDGPTFNLQAGYYWLSIYPLGIRDSDGDFNYLDITNIPNDTNLYVDLFLTGANVPSSSVTVQLTIDLYNESTYLSRLVGVTDTTTFKNGDFIFSGDCAIKNPGNATKCVPFLYIKTVNTQTPFTLAVKRCYMQFSISSLYRLQQQTGKTNELLEKVNEKLEANGQKLDDVLAQEEENGEKLDQIIQQPEQEKNEASSTGNDTASQITGAIPDQSADFSKALKDFTAAFAYEGLEAKLPLPEVRMPQIDGLLPSFVLMESRELDFGEYMRLIPENLLLLVQSLLTVALIIFCFKELYDTIQYVLTLKGGKE